MDIRRLAKTKIISHTISVLEHKKTTTQEHSAFVWSLFLLSPLEDVTQQLFFLQSLREDSFRYLFFIIFLHIHMEANTGSAKYMSANKEAGA